MEQTQTSFGRMESFILLYIWNQKCSIQYPVLHNYYTAWFFLVRLFFFSQVWQNYLLVRKLSQEGSFICVLGISNLHISTIFLLNAGTVPTVCYIFFHFIIGYVKCVLTALHVNCVILFDKVLLIEQEKMYTWVK
jgi:hypothetical protein